MFEFIKDVETIKTQCIQLEKLVRDINRDRNYSRSLLEFHNFALSFLGLPYKWGGDDTIQGYDCSGLVQDLLAYFGLDPKGDQTAQALYNHFYNTGIVKNYLHERTASLAFYGKSESKITHVAMFVNGEVVIEAGGGGSRTRTEEDAANQNAFIRCRPYNYRKDLIAIIKPNGLPW